MKYNAPFRQESFFNEGNSLGFSTAFECTATGLSFQFWKVVPRISSNPKMKGMDLNFDVFIFICIQQALGKGVPQDKQGSNGEWAAG